MAYFLFGFLVLQGSKSQRGSSARFYSQRAIQFTTSTTRPSGTSNGSKFLVSSRQMLLPTFLLTVVSCSSVAAGVILFQQFITLCLATDVCWNTLILSFLDPTKARTAPKTAAATPIMSGISERTLLSLRGEELTSGHSPRYLFLPDILRVVRAPSSSL